MVKSHIGLAYAREFNTAALDEIIRTMRAAADHCRISSYNHAAADSAFYDRAADMLKALAVASENPS